MSLLTIIQNALNEIGDTEVPSSIFSNLNPTAVQSLALANRTLKEVAKRTNWGGLSRTETLTMVASQEEYDLPSDFFSLVPETMWNTSQMLFNQVVSPQEWALLNGISATDTSSIFFRIFRSDSGNGQKIRFFPTPSVADTVTFEYVSDALTQSSGGTLQSDEFLADTDTALLDEDTISLGVKWRFLQSKGFPYAEEMRDYETSLSHAANAEGAPVIDMGRGTTKTRVLIIPRTGFGA